ncbi:MAG: hypothetical protein ACE5FA_00250 [Dehalococcoidia bacterium]
MSDPRAALYADICEFVAEGGTPRIRLLDDETSILAWTRSKDDGWLLFWRDVANKHHPHTALVPDSEVLEDELWTAAEKALYAGRWLYAIHLDAKLLPPDCAWLSRNKTRYRKKGVPDVIPIGAGTSLISIEALAKVFYCAPTTARRWLTEIGVPTLSAPGGRAYISLWALELCVLKKLIPELSWPELARQLKDAQTVYGAAKRSATVDRLRGLGESIKPASRLLQKGGASRKRKLKQGQ